MLKNKINRKMPDAIRVKIVYPLDEYKFEITANLYPYTPARITMDPYNSTPAEGGGMDVLSVKLIGGESGYEADALEFLFEKMIEDNRYLYNSIYVLSCEEAESQSQSATA